MSFVPLPRSVEQLLESIQSRHSQVPVDKGARQVLASLTEDSALSLLNQISPSTNIRNLSAFIMHLAKNKSDSNGGGVTCPAREQGNMPQMMSAHLEALSELEFRKAFLILSYLGRKRLEDEISPDYILSLKNLPMIQFEKEVWEGIGWKHIEPVDRRQVKLENVPLEEKSFEIVQNHLFRQPPLLIQFRMFKNGYAVKGTVLVDKRLPPRTIHVRRSMVKVSRDEGLPISQSVNSFEIVGTSNHPKQAYLSKYIIAHLSYGGVPKEYFLNLVENALDQAQNLRFNKRTALQAALRHGDMDKHIVSRMILCGIPIDEPFLQERLSFYMKEERKRLMSGKVPLEDCYYLMGTADPSHKLRPNEVCIIHENGHISGKVLVYKHPGLHFGDVHILTATYVREIADIVGNSKYAIFFPTTGSRSLAEEIANSDFDGDMYWVTRNPQLLDQFKASEPWERPSTKRKMEQPMPSEFSEEVLERKLFECFLNSRFGAWNIIGAAADSWLVYMDRLLTLGDECAVEKSCLKEKMLKLVNIYYDALDADKHGIEVNFPYELKPEKFPHFMERGRNEYKSKSVLGLIYDMVKSFEPKDAISEEICPLPCFCVEVPQASLDIWTARYAQYRKEMSSALGIEDKDDKNKEADRVLQVYTKMLYEAEDFEGSMRKKEDIFNEALAIYKITYRYAKDSNEIRRCGFAWKVAGHALCKLYTVLRNEESFSCSPSVLRELWG